MDLGRDTRIQFFLNFESFNLKARNGSGNTSTTSTGILVTTLGDAQAPTAPTALVNSAPSPTAFVLSWTAATDNIAVTSYTVYKDGNSIGTTNQLSMFVSGLPSTTYLMKVVANDFARNSSAFSTTLSVKMATSTGLYAYEGFNGTVNSGTGWGGNWSKTPAIASAIGITFGTLQTIGNKLGATAINMTRPLNLGITDGDSLCISYLCNENASDLSFILTSAAGGISFRNGKFQGDVAGAVQENSYMSSNLGGALDGILTTPVSINGTTSFNFIVIKHVGNLFQVKRWVYDNPANLPSAMPVLGDAKALTSGQYTSSDLSFLEITGIKLLCKSGTTAAYYDEIRMGKSFADVTPQTPNAITQNTMGAVGIFAQDGKIVVNLTDVNGTSEVSVYNTLGVLLKTKSSAGNEKLNFNLPTKGVYLVRVQNAGKQFTQKVILF